MNYLLYLMFCHVLGWIMTGYIVIRLALGADIRLQGSGNIGALNSWRIAGKKAFIFTFLGDSLKGALAVSVGIYMGLSDFVILLGLTAVITGHIWPLPLRFKGGKGAATFLGGLLVYDTFSLPLLILIFIMFYLLLRKFTIAGLIAFLLWPFYVWFQGNSLFMLEILPVTIIIWAHRTNITEYINNLRSR